MLSADPLSTRTLESYPLSCALRFVVVALAGISVIAGCDSNSDPQSASEISSVDIAPPATTIAPGETVDFDVVALNDQGDVLPSTNLDLRWWSSDETVFTVDNDGRAKGEKPGTAYCKVEATEPDVAKSARVRFVGRDSAFVTVF